MAVIGGWRFSHLSLTWTELSKYCTPKTFMDLAGPWVFWVYLPTSGACVLCRGFQGFLGKGVTLARAALCS